MSSYASYFGHFVLYYISFLLRDVGYEVYLFAVQARTIEVQLEKKLENNDYAIVFVAPAGEQESRVFNSHALAPALTVINSVVGGLSSLLAYVYCLQVLLVFKEVTQR